MLLEVQWECWLAEYSHKYHYNCLLNWDDLSKMDHSNHKKQKRYYIEGDSYYCN